MPDEFADPFQAVQVRPSRRVDEPRDRARKIIASAVRVLLDDSAFGDRGRRAQIAECVCDLLEKDHIRPAISVLSRERIT